LLHFAGEARKTLSAGRGLSVAESANVSAWAKKFYERGGWEAKAPAAEG